MNKILVLLQKLLGFRSNLVILLGTEMARQTNAVRIRLMAKKTVLKKGKKEGKQEQVSLNEAAIATYIFLAGLQQLGEGVLSSLQGPSHGHHEVQPDL